MGTLKQTILAAPFVCMLIWHAGAAAAEPRAKARVKVKAPDRCSIKFATVEVERTTSKGTEPDIVFRVALAKGYTSGAEGGGDPLSATLKLRCLDLNPQRQLALIRLTLNVKHVDRAPKRRPVRSTSYLSINSWQRVGERVRVGTIRPLGQPEMNVWIKLE